METIKHAQNRSYEDFDPVFKWRREQGRDTVELHLPGFKREQIRIQINHLGFLVITGERPLEGTRWRRFKKEFEIPKYCIEDGVRGNFTQNILSVVMPKKDTIIPQEEEDEQEEQMPELEDEEEEQEENKYLNMEFKRSSEEKNEKRDRELLHEDNYIAEADNQFAENNIVETTREVALKFMVVIIVIMVIVSYLVDKSKSLMAQAQSYFQN